MCFAHFHAASFSAGYVLAILTILIIMLLKDYAIYRMNKQNSRFSAFKKAFINFQLF